MEEGLRLDISLQETKEKFKQLTLTEAAAFTEEVEKFTDRFDREGPGNPETPMSEGLS